MKSLSVALAVSMLCATGHGQVASESTQRTVEIPMPTQLKIRQTENHLSDSFDLTSLRSVKITVSKDMFLGMKDEIRVYRASDPRPQKAGRLGYASIEVHGATSEPGFLKATTSWDRLRTGERYTVEHDITIFETNVPPGPHWQPEAPGRYRVLWDTRIKADSQ